MLTEAEIRQRFIEGYEFPPLKICLAEADRSLGRNAEIDAILAVELEGESFDFAAEFKSRSIPKVFEQGLAQIASIAEREQKLPMLVVPYLRETQLQELQQRQLSGIDLCGNGVVIIPGKAFVYRTGAKNQFPDSTPTKFAYRGATSQVARVFLCQRQFESLKDIEEKMNERGGKVVLSTISKALKRLESDVIIDRSGNAIRLLQPEKLLESLAKSYAAPKIRKQVSLSFKNNEKNLSRVAKLTAGLGDKQTSDPSFVLTGKSSISQYAVMGREEVVEVYTRNLDLLLKQFGDSVEKGSRFADLILYETIEPTVFFDRRLVAGVPYASPIQSYLECSAGDKREIEVADQIKTRILNKLD
ncbi:MAG: hypothetical protein IT422_06225 [Pirellulaceae bacterium]|nr:hypothetical protein [Pirellulaceae bacterium]